MNRQEVNPEDNWSANFFFNQGEVVEGAHRTLYLSGQISANTDPAAPMGIAVQFAGDQGKQIAVVLEKIDQLLAKANMERKHLIHIKIFTVDVPGFLANYELYANWVQEAGIKPTNSLIGVKELAMPDAMVEIEGIAVAPLNV